MTTTTRYTLTSASGSIVAEGRTMKQAAALLVSWGTSPLTVIGTDGVTYRLQGLRSLVPVGYVAPAMTAEQADRRAASMVDTFARASAERAAPSGERYDDAQAIEDLGLGTVDGGLWPRR